MNTIVMKESDQGEQPMDNGTIPGASPFGIAGNYNNPHEMPPPATRRRVVRKAQLRKGDGENNPDCEVKKYKCMHIGCARLFSSRFKLVRHILIHSGERRFSCNSCDRRFHRKDHLKNHLQVHNPNKLLHTCQLCRKSYCSILSFRKHVAFHCAESGDLVCKLCGTVCDNRESIMHHLKVHTGSRTLRGPSERKFPCDRCDRSFFTKKDVKRHLVVHTGKRDFLCQHCPQRFGRKDHLVRHTKKSHVTSVGTVLPPPDNLRNSHQPSIPLDNFSNGRGASMPMTSVTDLQRVGGISPPPIPSLLDPSVLDPVKQDMSYGSPQPNLPQTSFAMNHLPAENGQGLGRYSNDATLLPVSQYLPVTPSYPGVTPLLPHHYLNMSTSSNMLSGLGPDVLPPMSGAPSFSSSVSLDMGNPPLPHFSQAFQ